MENNYYVYFYLRQDGTPYYVGKGKEKRAWSKSHRVNVPSDPTCIRIVHERMTEEQALEYEKFYIKCYGRKDNNTGILRNMTDGGDSPPKHFGNSWNKGKTHSDETKKKRSDSLKGRIITEQARKKLSEAHKGKDSPLKGISRSEEVKQKISNNHKQKGIKPPSQKGKIRSEETKQKIRESLAITRSRKKTL